MSGFLEVTVATSGEKRCLNIKKITSFNPAKSVGCWIQIGENSFRIEESYESIKAKIRYGNE